MIKLDWNNDQRSPEVNNYLVDPNSDKESRRRAFMGGWTRYLNHGDGDSLDEVTWMGLGMVYASVLRDIAVAKRKDIYRLLLSQYVSHERVSHWTDEQRQEALRLVADADTSMSENLSLFCVYTIRHKQSLDETYRRGGTGRYEESRVWKTGLRLFLEAKRSGMQMPVVFASAEVTDKLLYHAMLSDIQINEAQGTTTYEFTDLQPIDSYYPLSSLTLRSTNQPLSDNHIRPYAICLTPSFIIEARTSEDK